MYTDLSLHMGSLWKSQWYDLDVFFAHCWNKDCADPYPKCSPSYRGSGWQDTLFLLEKMTRWRGCLNTCQKFDATRPKPAHRRYGLVSFPDPLAFWVRRRTCLGLVWSGLGSHWLGHRVGLMRLVCLCISDPDFSCGTNGRTDERTNRR